MSAPGVAALTHGLADLEQHLAQLRQAAENLDLRPLAEQLVSVGRLAALAARSDADIRILGSGTDVAVLSAGPGARVARAAMARRLTAMTPQAQALLRGRL